MRLILGGARSGKSGKATEFARDSDRVVYLATGVATDEEMESRIRRHKEDRPEGWRTIEEPLQIGETFEKLDSEGFSGVVILDCLGFWLSNFLREAEDLSGPELEEEVGARVQRELEPAIEANYDLVVVSNVVGMGVIPGTSAGRKFRDALGRVNQTAAAVAEEVVLMVAGLPLQLK
jgi:adenosylcobinamide kinase/adenosylcobinamide-phosphate guanylyltransferase